VNNDDLRFVIHELNRRLGLQLVYVVGSSAVFASLPHASHPELVATRDVDVALPPNAPTDGDRVELFMGEGSDFDEQNGFYVQSVDLETPRFAPQGWMERAVEIRVGTAVARCMELHDLALAKYGVGREKDLGFTRVLAEIGALDRVVLEMRLQTVDTDPTHRALIRSRIARDF